MKAGERPLFANEGSFVRYAHFKGIKNSRRTPSCQKSWTTVVARKLGQLFIRKFSTGPRNYALRNAAAYEYSKHNRVIDTVSCGLKR